jgi:2-isopropylmalate synthase
MIRDAHRLRHIGIFDTTLRDGEQAPGYSLTVDQKVQLALKLEALGVNTVECGFPMSSPIDFDATYEMCKLLKRARPCGFARAVPADVDACARAMKHAANPQIEIASVGSDIHILYKRETTRERVLAEALDAIRCAKAHGFTDISIAAEDATRSDFEFLKQLLGVSIECGARTLAIPDTVGACLPEEFYALIRDLRAFVGDGIRISVHCHNDMGLAVANTVAGIQAGADEVQTTLCGIGERAGNTSLEELIVVLNSKLGTLHRVHDIIHHRLFETCMVLARFLNLNLPAHKPVLGENAFSSEAGMHQQGLIKHRFTYEHLRAEDYGTVPRMVLGRHSGRNLIRQRLREDGVRDILDHLVDRIYDQMIADPDPRRYAQAGTLGAMYAALANPKLPIDVTPGPKPQVELARLAVNE